MCIREGVRRHKGDGGNKIQPSIPFVVLSVSLTLLFRAILVSLFSLTRFAEFNVADIARSNLMKFRRSHRRIDVDQFDIQDIVFFQRIVKSILTASTLFNNMVITIEKKVFTGFGTKTRGATVSGILCQLVVVAYIIKA